jgi:hypothetical protein
MSTWWLSDGEKAAKLRSLYMWKWIAGLLVFLILAAPTLSAQAYRVGVDPRVELMSVLFRLAGNNEYNQCSIPAYDAALHAISHRTVTTRPSNWLVGGQIWASMGQ